MNYRDAVEAFGALAQMHRLQVYRLLVVQGPSGLAAGEIAAALGVAPSTLTFHLKVLENAGLTRSWRDGRFIRYAVEVEAMRRVVGFLAADCCDGRPELCGSDLAAALPYPDTPERTRMADKLYNVLFLCAGNSARSIFAEAILNRLGQGRFRACSAGSRPRGSLHAQTLALLAKYNHPTAALRSKSWDEFAAPGAPQMDFVFTVCDTAAGEVCPVWPGQPMTAHWAVPDPAALDGRPAEVAAAFADAYGRLWNRISIFVSLPIRSLDRLSLQHRLDEIGRRQEVVLPQAQGV